MNKKWWLWVGALLWLWSCVGKGKDHAGGAGSETNYGISAQLIDAQGQNLAQVSYSLRPAWYARPADNESVREVLPVTKYFNGISDDQGRINLPLLAPGSYVLDAQNRGLGVLQTVEVASSDTVLSLGMVTLDSVAAVTGVIPLIDNIPMRVRVYGTERYVWTDSAGNFTLHNLPPGARLLIVDQPEKAVIVGEVNLDPYATQINLDADMWGEAAFNASTWTQQVQVSATSFLRDSIWEQDPRWSHLEVPLLLYLDHNSIDFSQASPVGSDVRITNSNNQLLPTKIRYWDPLERRALLWVKSVPQDLVLYYGKSGATAVDSSRIIWENWPDSLRSAYTRIDLDDFEDGDIYNNLPGMLPQYKWVRGIDTLTYFVEPHADSSSIQMLVDDTLGRGKVLRLRYKSFVSSWVVMGTTLSAEPQDLRMLDSLVLWARGDGNMVVALENSVVKPEIKAWKYQELTADWKRYVVRPQDFAPPSIGGNLGWDAVKTEITTFSVFGQGGTEIWIDDVQIYGISPLELQVR